MERVLFSTDIALRRSAGHESNSINRYRRGEFMPGEVGVGFRYGIIFKRIIGNQNPSRKSHGTRLLSAQPNLRN